MMSYQSNILHPVTIDLTRSSRSRSISPLPSAPADILKIANAPEDVVRAVLIALCQDPMQKRKAMSHMEKLSQLKSEQPQSQSLKGDASTRDINGATNQTDAKKTNKRRAIAEMAICENCNEPFSQDTNSPEACHYHPGEMECDNESDFWADHDDDCHGDRFSKELMEEYPEGYIWSCCEQPGDSDGCTLGSHEGLYKKPYNQTSLIW